MDPALSFLYSQALSNVDNRIFEDYFVKFMGDYSSGLRSQTREPIEGQVTRLIILNARPFAEEISRSVQKEDLRKPAIGTEFRNLFTEERERVADIKRFLSRLPVETSRQGEKADVADLGIKYERLKQFLVDGKPFWELQENLL